MRVTKSIIVFTLFFAFTSLQIRAHDAYTRENVQIVAVKVSSATSCLIEYLDPPKISLNYAAWACPGKNGTSLFQLATMANLSRRKVDIRLLPTGNLNEKLMSISLK